MIDTMNERRKWKAVHTEEGRKKYKSTNQSIINFVGLQIRHVKCGGRNSVMKLNKYAQSNLGTGSHRGGLSGSWTVQHCAVACIHEYASCPSAAAAAAAVNASRAASFCCVHLSSGRRIVTF